MFKARGLAVWVGALAMGLLGLACGADKGTGSGGSGSGNRGAGARGGTGLNLGGFANEPLPGAGARTGTGGPITDDDTCGQRTFNLNRLPPEVILVQDRSGSMMRDIEGRANRTPTRWAEALAAVEELMRGTAASVHWGLQIYPTCTPGPNNACTPSSCDITGGYVAPAVNQGAAINQALASTPIQLDTGATPTRRAVEIATAALRARTTPNPKFILLATDGLANCRNQTGPTGSGGDDPDGALRAVQAAVQAGIGVYVVGFATSNVPDAHRSLNDMAVAGGFPLPGDVKYYSAQSRAQLVTAMTSIASAVQDCTFNLGEAPPAEATTFAVEIDGMRVPENQWTWGAGRRTIVVSGAACDRLKSGQSRGAAVKWRCDGLAID